MSTPEKHSFQAEIQQLLHIVVHSLYTDKEIFVRELVSNAADACEKLRFLQTSGQSSNESTPLTISLQPDEKEGTLSIVDTGIGMTREELMQNLGTVAHSGSKAFLQKISQQGQADAQLIGQFGVGFYSAFMVAQRVTVWSRSHLPDQGGWKWTADGTGTYELEPAADLPRGTKIVLHLKDDAKEFAQSSRIESILRRYSNFVSFPIELGGKVINTVRAIWGRNKAEIKDEEYNEFYHYIGHDSDNPRYRLHFSADAPLAIQSLLFVPARNIEAMGMARLDPEVHLYCRKVLIQSRAKGLLPEWLRFLRGVVDSEDLPLNISRETMQDSTLLQKLNRVLTGRFLKFLEEQAEKDPAGFDAFYDEFNRFLKEGVTTDFTHRESLGKLLRYESSRLEKGKRTSLADYVSRMAPDQKEIYYLLAPTREAAESSPYYEVFQSRNLEVLYFSDPWDEFVMEHLREFQDKPVLSAEKANLTVDPAATNAPALSGEEGTALTQWLKETLGDLVREVRLSERLVGSPAVMVDPDKALTASMKRILKNLNKESGLAAQDLEINSRHPLIHSLAAKRQTDPALAREVAEQLLDNARVAAGLMEDPRSMVKRLNQLLARVLGPSPAATPPPP